jgi:signal transduction histidine kinase/ActR/RegA family two-component response regulator
VAGVAEPSLTTDEARVDRRVMVLTATSRDAALTGDVLAAAGLEVACLSGFDALVAEVRRGAAAILIAEETLSFDRRSALAGVLHEQPPWSDLPVLILARPGADSDEVGAAVAALGNVTLLERPLRVATLLTAVRSAVRARERQYEIRANLAEQASTEALLRESDRRKDEFLATLGHELRNPLAPLLTGLQLLRIAGQSDPEVLHLATVMERQLQHLIRLVDDLLELSRITRGVIDVRRTPLDLRRVIHTAVETCRSAIAANRHELSVSMPDERVTVIGDAVRLTQVFSNLLGNAVKYTNPGGHIALTLHRQADRAVVTVRDDGIGIPEAQLHAVFEMFTQVNRSSRRSQGGLGIGLTLVKSLVESHGGHVEAHDLGAGIGTEFVVDLPVSAVPLPAEPGPSVVGPLPTRRILVVDDNVDAADTLALLLETLGATVAVAYGGREALEAVVRFRPDTLLLDVGMPEVNGYDVARMLRATPGHEDLLLIALTGWGQEQDRARSREAGFNHHMVKPPDLAQLRRLLSAGAGGGEGESGPRP